MTEDPYRDSGEFIDVLSAGSWQVLRDPVRRALGEVDEAGGPLVDLGAGSGLGTVMIAEELPRARIIAIEPSPILRAVLLARVCVSEDLRGRVSVTASTAQDADLPERLGGVLAVNMIGHLAPAERQELWRGLRPRLVGRAPLIVTVQPPAEPARIAEAEFARVTVGDHSYRGSGSAYPTGPDSVIWRISYQVHGPAGELMRELVVEYPWFVLSPGALESELRRAGYDVDLLGVGVVHAVVRP